MKLNKLLIILLVCYNINNSCFAQDLSPNFSKFKKEKTYENLREFYYLVFDQPDSMLHYCKLTAKEIGKENGLNAILSQMYSDHYYLVDSFAKSQEFLFSAVEFHEKNEPIDTVLLMDAYINIGVNYERMNNFSRAINAYDKAIGLYANRNNQPGLADIYANKGTTYFRLGDYKKAISFMQKANEIDVANNDSIRIASNYNNLGRVYVEFKKLDTGIEFYKKSLDICLKLGNEKDASRRYNNIGNAYAELKNFELADQYLKKSLEIELKNSRFFNAALRFQNLGQLSFKTKKKKAALDYMSKAANIFKQYKDTISYIETISSQGMMYLAGEENKSDAYRLMHEAYQLSKKTNALEAKRLATENLYLYNRITSNFKEALRFYELKVQIEDSIFNKESQNAIENLEVKYETEKKEAQIASLNKESEQQKTIIAQKEREQIFWISFIALMIVAFGVILFFLRKIRKQKDNLSQLNNIKNRLFAVISHDLRGYSTVFQDASFVLNHHVKKGNYDKVLNISKDLEQSAHSVDIQLNNVLNWASSQLQNYTINKENLNPQNELNQIIKSLEHSIELKGNTIENKLPENWQLQTDKGAFNTIFHNLLTNANKFTENGTISIKGIENNGHYQIAVEDTGIGIDKEKIKNLFEISGKSSQKGTQGEKGSGIGLSLVKHYADLANIQISASSELSKGTKLDLIIPKN